MKLHSSTNQEKLETLYMLYTRGLSSDSLLHNTADHRGNDLERFCISSQMRERQYGEERGNRVTEEGNGGMKDG